MRLAIASIALALTGASLTGCTLYFGDGDDDPPVCGSGSGGVIYPETTDGAPQYQLRDPYTNTCSYFGGGGGSGGECYYDKDCNWVCNGGGYDDGYKDGGVPPQQTDDGGTMQGPPVPDGGGSGSGTSSGGIAIPPYPDYPQCGTRCDQLSENDCLAAAECQATYTNNYFAYPPDEPGKLCGGFGNIQCDAGYTCVIPTDTNDSDPSGYCYPNDGSGGGIVNGGTGSGSGSGGSNGPNVPIGPQSFAGCYSTGTDYGSGQSCYGLDANACVHRDDCSPIYDNYGYGNSFDSCIPEKQSSGTCDNVSCGPGNHCEQECVTEDSNDPFTDCVAQCVPDGDSCASVDCAPGYTCVDECDTMDPTAGGNAPAGQCWASCQPTESCMALDEQTCDSRSDCTSVFDGENCTCYPGGYCDCEVLTWKRCDDVNAMPL